MSSSESRFKENLAKLRATHPAVAVKLQYVDPSEVQVVMSLDGQPTLLREIGDKKFYYHDQKSPVGEATKWRREFDLSHTEALYIYGVGLGYFFDVLEDWLEEDELHHLIFVEDDIAVLRRFLETERATQVLDHPKVQVHFLPEGEQREAVVDWLTWYFVELYPVVHGIELYTKKRGKVFRALQQDLVQGGILKARYVAEMRAFGAAFFANFYANLLRLEGAAHGRELFGCFKGVPAIVCGAGPSLNRNFELLKTLQDRALIFAGGSSVNALSNQGLLPHFGAGMDPNPGQVLRLETQSAFEVPFFVRSRMHRDAVDLIAGERLHLPGSEGYPVAAWFDQKLGFGQAWRDGGRNIVNSVIALAVELGCSPIILVGLDLAFTDMQAYASGVVERAGVAEGELLRPTEVDMGAFHRDDIYGKPVYTNWQWVGESEWIGELAKSRPEANMINATEGGIGMPGVENMSLAKVAERYLRHSYDLDAWVHAEVQNVQTDSVELAAILDALREMYSSLGTCVQLIQICTQATQETERKLKAGESVPENLVSAEERLTSVALLEELSYKQILGPMCKTPFRALERIEYEIKHDPDCTSDTEKQLRRLQLVRKKYRYLLDAAYVNRRIIREALQARGVEAGFGLEEGEAEIAPPIVHGREKAAPAEWS